MCMIFEKISKGYPSRYPMDIPSQILNPKDSHVNRKPFNIIFDPFGAVPR